MNAHPTMEELLDRMTDALQRGALDELPALAAALEVGMADLTGIDAARAQSLRRRAQRNDVCLQAAARGVRAALARIRGIGGTELATYGADGRMVTSRTGFAHHTARL